MKRLSSDLHVILALCICVSIGFIATPCIRADAGKIVVNFDDWTLSDAGFWYTPGDAGLYAQNVADWFTSGSPGQFIGYDRRPDYFYHFGDSIGVALEVAGHAWVLSSSTSFTVDELTQYDGVFVGAWPLGHDVANVLALGTYVMQGGNVYIYGGSTFYGSIAADREILNSFLYQFGLAFPLDTCAGGTLSVNSSHPVLAAVAQLYGDCGTCIADLDPGDPRNELIATSAGCGLVGVADFAVVATRPTSWGTIKALYR